jgi:3-deoxy-manno-octulosonate cytidylyltransferase (CMP-KDO synthetase)
MSAFVIVIPARFESQRLPGKPLADIHGRPLIEHVWRAAKASDARQVVVATDDARIREVVRGFGGECVMTAKTHVSGSDRIAECAGLMGWDSEQLIVNLQGDEPEMPAACLQQVADLAAADDGAAVATLCWPIDSGVERDDPNIVKVAMTAGGRALYFSRSAIPHARGQADFAAASAAGLRWYRHLGLYCYRNSALQAFTRWPAGQLEQAEKLEQLRFLEQGSHIAIAQACAEIPPGIDTPQDLAVARMRFR